MATSSRLRGNINPIFTLKKTAGGAATSYADDLKKYDLKHEPKPDSDLTFAEAAAGLADDAVFTATTVASWDAAALYAFLWDNAGAEVEVTFGPYGNATPTATKPHFKFTGTLPSRPSGNNEARRTPEGADAEFEIKGNGPATKLIA